MTSAVPDEAELRRWLIDYLITEIGCDSDEVGLDVAFNDLGVGSRDAVVLSGELATLINRSVSPVDFWQHPTINELVQFLTTPESESAAQAVSAERGSVDEPIAVIGLGCRFPGEVCGPDAFWRFLGEGRSSITEVPADRWEPFDDGSPEIATALAATTRWASVLTDVDGFDAEFFEISPREATAMDPQQRLLLEVAWEALEHAGIPAESLRRSQTGVFAGACATDYGYLAGTDLSRVDAWSNIGGALSIIANRLSYVLDLRGPSVSVDTACSSSLVAVHLAAQSLRTGDCDLAIAAGVNLLLSPAIFRSFDGAEALSPTGRCKSFDADADGFVRGEGCGAVILKRVSDAVRDGDRVLAVIRGSAVNQDGRSNGLMAPNPAAQMAVLRAACANAGVAPHQVDYVETHGTGTLLGDPIEARALGTVLGRGRPENGPLLMGAVKSNMGHLEGAAGIAGLIKAVLAVHRGHIPPNLNFATPNPHIPFQDMRLKVVAEPTDWPDTGLPRRAGVSSFGFGGTNAHVVVEQAPATDPVASRQVPAVSTLVVSGKTTERVASWASALAEWMDGDGADVALADVAHTLNHHRPRHALFGTVCARDSRRAIAGLRALADGKPADGVVLTREGKSGPGTVFVYSGQGSQWAGMGQQLLADEPAFAAAVAELEPTFVAQAGFSLQQVLAEGRAVTGIERIQPVLVGVQLALTTLWRSYGIEPSAVIGHSMGEVTAAVVAGALSVADGLRVIATRSRLMARLAGQGAMALLESDAAATEKLLVDYPQLSIAVYASPGQTVIAGPPEQVDAVMAVVAGGDRLARRIEVDVASHHRIIEPILPELCSELADLTPDASAIPVISTTCGPDDTPVFDADHWAANLRNPVRFSQAVAMAGADHSTFVEISPHPLLTHAINDILGAGDYQIVSTLQRDADDTLAFHSNVNASHTTTAPQTPHPPEPHPPLPTAPWHHTRHWLGAVEHRARLAAHDGEGSAVAGGHTVSVHPLLGAHVRLPEQPERHVWAGEVGTTAHPWLSDHQVHAVPAFPGAAYCEMALAAARATLGDASEVRDIRFEQMLLLDEQTPLHADASVRASGVVDFEVQTDHDGEHARRASATLRRADEDDRPAAQNIAGLLAAHPNRVDGDGLRQWFEDRGVRFGPAFAGLAAAYTGDGTTGTVLAEIEVPQSIRARQTGYGAHPALLDACFQSVAAHARISDVGDGGMLLPVGVRRLRSYGPLQHARYCLSRVTEANRTGMETDLNVLDENGTVLLIVRGLRIGGNVTESDARRRLLAERLLAIDWQQRDLPAAGDGAAGAWLLLTASDADNPLAAQLADALKTEGAQCKISCWPTAEQVDVQIGDAGGVVVLTGPAAEGNGEQSPARGREQVRRLVRIARALTESADEPPRLYVVTRNAQTVLSDDRPNLDQAGLRGLMRVIAAEDAHMRATQIDLDEGADAAQVVRQLLAGSDEDETAWRDGRWYAARLRAAPLRPDERRTAIADRQLDGMRLEIRTPGDLQGLELVAFDRISPGPGQIEVAVTASSLNFADVLIAMGRFPSVDGRQPRLGMDFAGVVTAVGPGVTDHQVGDRVGGVSENGCWATFVSCDANLAVTLPPGLDAEQAAAATTAYATAWYGLQDMARIKAGERVLIHSATGGVGRAAIAIARLAGAEIFATAGSPQRRALLHDMGIEHVYDSRSTEFAEEIRRDTDGYGVDVVLNSVTGAAQRAGFELLAIGGRFVEIGKRDVYGDTRLGLYPFRRNLTFHYLDLALMAASHPKQVGDLLRTVYRLVGDRELPALEHTTYPLDQAATAIRVMGAAEHNGKLILSIPREGQGTVVVPPERASVFRGDGAYIITGGLGGLGLLLAAEMGKAGCGRIVLTARADPTAKARQAIERIRAGGVDVVVECGNMAEADTAARLVAVATATGLPLRGVLHAAAVVVDATLANITDEVIDRDWAPKVYGAWNLHRATTGQPLDWFCCFSSAAALLGSAGQGAYAAANSWVDGFTIWRRSLGLPALAIAWGPWGEIGRATHLAEGGRTAMIAPDEGAYAFEELLRYDRGYAAYIPTTGTSWLTPLVAHSPFAEAFQAGGDHQTGATTVRTELRSLPQDEWPTRLRRLITEQTGLILRRTVDPDRPFVEHGLDSLGNLELRTRIEAEIGIRITPKAIATHNTAHALSLHLAETLVAEEAATATPG
ncbi:sulfolipid-1 biosynthesis phthioceranic/hydroxyphthioceranic acid synthase [Mycobacterium sp. Aquia_216]|uniref:sulfolipid-1 biosynthesis phthioceranic/hydroxyphthioceranic acid synthase n=1 Tax=Mycobacterium sp. Aquia_216 TaxID=2991729 RepID=UPI00227A0582|nr:sulfolipid-1 biosynthesis phthioceranic/hydroxyphthioceranic acid synthase [Mycobacterium sp. Aquia_216]WAJ46836.1 sulfolipid-1 biosynthesis phthioceranic/hydroxyphthioceranic acid synthase [Mycobacterium sp. Aquia_216]